MSGAAGAASAGPLDPEARDLIAAFEASAPPTPDRVSLEEFRQGAYEALRIAIDPPYPTLAKNISVPGASGDLPARRFRPTEGEPEGLLVYFHGGGFVRGDLDTHDPLCRALAGAAGATVISVAYRRAPEDPFPAAADDAIAATAWATGGSAGPVAVGGDSSGGNLAAVAALEHRGRLAAQLLLYPITDATMSAPSLEELAEGRMLTRASMEWFYDQYVPDRDQRTDPRASPLLASDHGGLAPAIVVTAGQDPVRDDGERYAAKLEAAGTPVVHLTYPGTVHSFMLYAGALASGREGIEAVGAALRRSLRTERNPALK